MTNFILSVKLDIMAHWGLFNDLLCVCFKGMTGPGAHNATAVAMRVDCSL